MNISTIIHRIYVFFVIFLLPTVALSKELLEQGKDAGVSGLWVLANISYAGMRAQNNPSMVWRIISFIFGLPGTIVTLLVVKEGSNKAYGIEIPKRST